MHYKVAALLNVVVLKLREKKTSSQNPSAFLIFERQRNKKFVFKKKKSVQLDDVRTD